MGVLSYMSMDGGKKEDDCGTLVGYAVAFFVCYYFALYFTTGKK